MNRMTTLCAILGTLLACDPSTKIGAQNAQEDTAGTGTHVATSADSTIETLTNRLATLESEMEQEKKELTEVKAKAAACHAELDVLRRKVDSLQGSINDLTSAVQSANGVAQANTRYLEQNRVTISRASDLLDYVRVEDEDLIIESANLHIRSGAGSTDAEPNGLGNLVVGYGESASYGDPTISGSHNLVVGPHHKYSSHSCLLVGDGEYREVAEDPYCAVLP